MDKKRYAIRMGNVWLFMFLFSFSFCKNGYAQQEKLYPKYTKWYQDPLGLRPLQLSSAAGFVWGSTAITACFLFTKKSASFQKRSSLYEETSAGFGYKPPYTLALQNNTGLLYKVRDWMSVGIEWNTLHFSDKINHTWSFGLRPFARWYPYAGRKVKLFFEYGAGLSYSLQRFPLTGTGYEGDTTRTGTQFNFITKYGAGAELYLSSRLSLQTGLRHFHLSNGNMKGIQRNPSHDSNGLFAGFLYALHDRR